MGRSVSYPRNAAVVCFRLLAPMTIADNGNEVPDDSQDGYHEEFDCLVEWVKDASKAAWPSLYDCDGWLDREDHVLLANGHCFIGVSEYCGMVAVWLAPKENYSHTDTPELAGAWCRLIAPRFERMFAQYRKVATFSNGEAVYAKA